MALANVARTTLFVYLKGRTSHLGETQRKNFINDLFNSIGAVHSIYIPTNKENGELFNYCFVEMDTEEAQKAINEIDNTSVEGVLVRVGVANKKKDNRSGSGRYHGNNSRSE